MSRHGLGRAITRALCCMILMSPAAVRAADLGAAPQQDGGLRAPRSNCRVIPQPQLNLWGEVTTYVPTMVCVSRGLYADTFPPPPPPQRFLGIW